MKNFNINFEKLQIFRILCELQSFSMVAKQLNTNQSVVSRHIKDLEKSFNQKIISNNQKPIMLTAYGKFLHEKGINLLDDSSHIEEMLIYKNNQATNTQSKVFVSISIILSCVLSEKIKKMLKTFPELFIDISFTNEITMDLLKKKDLVITKEPYDHLFVNNHFFNTYEMYFGASREYLQKRGYPKYISSLRYHEFVYIQNYYYDSFINKEFLPYLSNKYLVDNELGAIRAMQIGAGIGVVPKFISKAFPEIVTFKIEEQLKPLNIYCSVSNLKNNCYIDLLIDFLKTEAGIFSDLKF